MTQLGKYSTDRDNILHLMCTCDWANDSFGNVEAPTGYVWRISNARDDVFGCFDQGNSDLYSLIEDQLAAYDIEDTPEFRNSLVGHFLVWEDNNGLVSVLQFPTEQDLLSVYSTLQDEYDRWGDVEGY